MLVTKGRVQRMTDFFESSPFEYYFQIPDQSVSFCSMIDLAWWKSVTFKLDVVV